MLASGGLELSRGEQKKGQIFEGKWCKLRTNAKNPTAKGKEGIGGRRAKEGAICL